MILECDEKQFISWCFSIEILLLSKIIWKISNSFFEELPKKWGLKGDPYLWEEVKRVFIKHNRDFTVGTFQSSLNGFISGFTLAHGKKISNDIIHVEKFPYDGVSKGSVSLVWWKKVGVPFLVKRFEENTTHFREMFFMMGQLFDSSLSRNLILFELPLQRQFLEVEQ